MPDEGPPSKKVENTNTSEKKADPVTSNFLAAAVFTAFLAAVTAYLKTTDNLPDKLRYPAHFTCIIVLVVILVQFAFNTVRLMQAKHNNDMKAAQIEAARLDNQLKEVQTSKLQEQKRSTVSTDSEAVVSDSQQRPELSEPPQYHGNEMKKQTQILGLQGNQDDGQ